MVRVEQPAAQLGVQLVNQQQRESLALRDHIIATEDEQRRSAEETLLAARQQRNEIYERLKPLLTDADDAALLKRLGEVMATGTERIDRALASSKAGDTSGAARILADPSSKTSRAERTKLLSDLQDRRARNIAEAAAKADASFSKAQRDLILSLAIAVVLGGVAVTPDRALHFPRARSGAGACRTGGRRGSHPHDPNPCARRDRTASRREQPHGDEVARNGGHDHRRGEPGEQRQLLHGLHLRRTVAGRSGAGLGHRRGLRLGGADGREHPPDRRQCRQYRNRGPHLGGPGSGLGVGGERGGRRHAGHCRAYPGRAGKSRARPIFWR